MDGDNRLPCNFQRSSIEWTGLKDYFFHCNICRFPFRDARTLPCFHYFCSVCLENRLFRSERFRCPTCDAPVELGEKGIESLPQTYFLKGIAEIQQVHDPFEPPLLCINKSMNSSYCKSHKLFENDCEKSLSKESRVKSKDKEHKAASVKCIQCSCNYCEDCSRSHCYIEPAKDHRLIKFPDLKGKHYETAAKIHVECCALHKKILTHFCTEEDCSTAVCKDCIRGHHASHNVVVLSDLAEKERQDCKQFSDVGFAKAIETSREQKSKYKRFVQHLMQTQGTIIANIKTRAKIAYDELERQECEAITQTTEMVQKIMSENKDFKMLNEKEGTFLCENKLAVDNIATFTNNSELAKLYPHIDTMCKKILESSAPTVFEWPKGVEAQFIDEPFVNLNIAIVQQRPSVQLTRTLIAFDDIVTDLTIHRGIIIALSKPVGKDHRIFVESSDQTISKALQERILKACPKPHRLVSLNSAGIDDIAVSDRSEKIGGDPLRQVSVRTDFVKICHLSSGHYDAAALTVNTKGQLVFVDYTPPKSLKVMRDRNTVHTIFQNTIEKELLLHPWAICCNVTGDIVVSDCDRHAVFVISDTGKVIAEYKNFYPGKYVLYPLGVCTDDLGHILVADRDRHCIHRLGRCGDFIDFIITDKDGLYEPVSLCFKSPCLYIGNGIGHIKVYKMGNDKDISDKSLKKADKC